MQFQSIAILALSYAGLASPAFAAVPTAHYVCAGGTGLSAKFDNQGPQPSVTLILTGSAKRVRLPQVLSADGGRYANQTMEFWIHGQSASLTRGGKAVACKTKA
jgi:membrane-bound inhibitor of C-type lysozyme